MYQFILDTCAKGWLKFTSSINVSVMWEVVSVKCSVPGPVDEPITWNLKIASAANPRQVWCYGESPWGRFGVLFQNCQLVTSVTGTDWQAPLVGLRRFQSVLTDRPTGISNPGWSPLLATPPWPADCRPHVILSWVTEGACSNYIICQIAKYWSILTL